MILPSGFYVLEPVEQAYLSQNGRFWVRPNRRDNPGGYTKASIGVFPLDEARQLLEKRDPTRWNEPATTRFAGKLITAGEYQLQLQRQRSCIVCGAHEFAATLHPAGGRWLCTKHLGRTPCAIHGCEGSTGRDTVVWICGKHWRTACPPGSKERKAYNRLFRLATKFGCWPDSLNKRFWIVWRAIVRRGNARVRGDLDIGEINRIMGW